MKNNGNPEQKVEPEKKIEDMTFSDVEALQAAQSPEAQQLALQSIQEEVKKYNLVGEGLDAKKNLDVYDERCRQADKIAREFYKDNPAGYNRHCARVALKEANERKAMVQAVQAEMKHGVNVAMKNDTERRAQAIADKDMLDAAGVLANTAADAEVATDATNSSYERVDGEHEFALDKLKQQYDAELAAAKTDADKKAAEERFKARKAGIDTASVAARAAIGAESINTLTGISKRGENWARQRAESLRADFRNIFMQRYKAHRAMNQSHEIAYANSVAATRGAVMNYFKTRIESGQVSSVLYTLDELEKSGDAAFKETVTEQNPTGTFNPSYYSFCWKSDIAALRKAAIAQIEEQRVLRNRQLIESQRGVKLKEQALLDDITRHAIGVAEDGSTPLYKNEEERIKAQRELYDRAAALKKEADAVGYSTRNVFKALSNEPRKYLAMKERSELLMRKALGQQYVAEQEKMVEDEILNLAKSATKGGQVDIDVPVRDEQTGKEGTVKMKVDVHRAIVDAIDCARANGLCKGKQFTMMRNQHASSKRYMQMIEDVANKYFSFGIESSLLGNDGKWTDRAAGSTTRIYLSEADGDSFRADNVRANMRVKVALRGKKADTDEGWFDTTDRYVNSDTLNQIIKASKEYLDSKLNPTMEDLDTVFGRAIREAIDKDNIKSFQGDTLDTVRRHFDKVFQDHEETFGVWRNGPSTTFFGAPVGSWNQGGQTQRITVAGERRWQDVRDIIPLTQRIRNRRLRDAMIDAQYDESQGRGIDEQIKDLLDDGDTDQD